MKKPIIFFKQHGRPLTLGVMVLFLITLIVGCLFLIFGPTSNEELVRIQSRSQTTINMERVDALLKQLGARAPSGRAITENPFANPEGLTVTSGAQ